MKKSEWKKEYRKRFERHEDELKWLYCELYHNDMGAYEYFTDMLYRSWSERPESLKKIDIAREECPDWYRGHDLTGMQLYVGAFAGNIRGVMDRLDYIEDCGANYLHLMPLLESPEGRSDGGYAVSNFRKVRPDLGTMEDLSDLAEACHSRGISLCLDFVMNHTSEDHEWARRAREGDPEYQKRYFFYDTWDIPNWYDQTVPQVFPTTAPGNFTWCPEAGKIVMTTFYPYQWDLNYSNPMVFNDMTENMLFLCNHGVDIIRLDALPYIWKVIGTQCRNLPQVHTLSRMLRMVCEIVCPGTLLLGEVVMEPSRVVPYFGTREKPECHLLYNVTTMATVWHTVATRDTRLLRHQLGQVFSLPGEYLFLNYLRCHDDIGWGLDYGFLGEFGWGEVSHKKFLNDYFTGKWPGSQARGELYNDDPRLGDARLCGTTASLCGMESAEENGDPEGLEKAVTLDSMLHALIFSMSGIPVLYSGDEIGRLNDYGYHDDPLKDGDSRYLHRGNMDWDMAARRNDPETAEGMIFSILEKLRKIREKYVVFDDRADTWLIDTGNDAVLGIGRYSMGEKLLALFNFADRDQTVWLRDESLYTDLISGEETDAGGVKLKGRGFRWLYQDMNGNE